MSLPGGSLLLTTTTMEASFMLPHTPMTMAMPDVAALVSTPTTAIAIKECD